MLQEVHILDRLKQEKLKKNNVIGMKLPNVGTICT